MHTTGQTMLITGGATGIGLALAERFLAAGNTVLVCGRRRSKLEAARDRFPALHIRECDLADPAQREALRDWALGAFPSLNVLVNNAGIQQRLDFRKTPAWEDMRIELETNLAAPIHLSSLFLPHLLGRERAAIVNVTSGLAFSPLANVPVYSATKAALRSYTLSLRRQLEGTPVEVIEIIPPAVDTDLGGPGLHTFGAPVGAFLDSVWEQVRAGKREAAYGFAAEAAAAGRDQLDAIFDRMNRR
jgi:uncharacterized oxidoreductase